MRIGYDDLFAALKMLEHAYESNIASLKAFAIPFDQVFIVYLMLCYILKHTLFPSYELCINAPAVHDLCLVA